MNRRLEAPAHLALYGLALLWPVSVYGLLPRVPLSGGILLSTMLCVLSVVDAIKGRRVRIPFELAWPAVLLFAVVSFHATDAGLAPEFGILLFLAAIHCAPPHVVARACLRIAAISGIAAAAWTLAGPALGLPATAYDIGSGATLHFAGTVPQGVGILLTALLLGTASAVEARRRSTRIGFALAAALVATALMRHVVLPAWSHGLSDMPLRLAAPRPAWAAMGLSLWIAARVIAKIEATRRETPDRDPLLLPLGLAALSGLLVCLGLFHFGDAALPLALAATCTLPSADAETAPTFRKRWLVAIPLAGYCVFSALRMAPVNPSDPRNYDVVARTELAAKGPESVIARMRFLQGRHPHERKTHFWMAQAALAEGHAYRAAWEFHRALVPIRGHRLILPPPSPEEGDEFLSKLRDFCSALPRPDTCFAYELALVAAGRSRDALQLLRLRTNTDGYGRTRTYPDGYAGGVPSNSKAFGRGD